MAFNRILSKVLFFVSVLILQFLIPNSVRADELASQTGIKTFSPDPFEYQVISEEEAFELHLSEDEYDPAIIEKEFPSEGDVVPHTGSTFTYCNEADCNNIIVAFGGVPHPASAGGKIPKRPGDPPQPGNDSTLPAAQFSAQ